MVSEMRLEQTFDLRCLHRVYSWIPTMHILHLTETNSTLRIEDARAALK